MFLSFMFIIVSLASNIASGVVDFARSSLTDDLTDAGTTITVASTTGFPDVGIIIIGDERIAYSATGATTFTGSISQPLVRGISGTTAIAHATGAKVSTLPGAMLNTAADYHIAVLADSAGLQAFIAKPVAAFQLIGSFLFLPLTFLGTDLQILTVFWAVIGIGMTVALFITLAGGRRV